MSLAVSTLKKFVRRRLKFFHAVRPYIRFIHIHHSKGSLQHHESTLSCLIRPQPLAQAHGVFRFGFGASLDDRLQRKRRQQPLDRLLPGFARLGIAFGLLHPDQPFGPGAFAGYALLNRPVRPPNPRPRPMPAEAAHPRPRLLRRPTTLMQRLGGRCGRLRRCSTRCRRPWRRTT